MIWWHQKWHQCHNQIAVPPKPGRETAKSQKTKQSHPDSSHPFQAALLPVQQNAQH
uniref:D-xylose-proton symporter-like 3ic isoform X1 n=1 Tax=Rhizophora mucronata TaxID=61149 RepID=A0A2P2KD79_RHIMU